MAAPKKKQSRTRSKKTTTAWRSKIVKLWLNKTVVTTCPVSADPKILHRISPFESLANTTSLKSPKSK